MCNTLNKTLKNMVGSEETNSIETISGILKKKNEVKLTR